MKDGTYEYDGYKIEITDNAVVNITQLRPNVDIVIPEGVKELSCTIKEATIRFPHNIERVGCYLEKCDSLEELIIPNNVNYCSAYLDHCSSIRRIVLGKNVSELYLGIDECLKLDEIIVNPENKHFASMDGVLFSKDMKKIIKCPTGKRGTYKVPASVSCIGLKAFTSTHLTEILLPDSVTRIEYEAFETDSKELKKIDVYHPGKPYVPSVYDLTLPPHLKSIAYGCFRFTNELHTVFIPKAVTSIGNEAFQQTSVQEVTFEEGSQLFDIENCAFERSCLESFRFPSQLKHVNPSAFYGCKNLESLSVSPKNRTFSIKDGVVFKDCGKTLFRAPCTLSGSYTVRKGVTRIESYAFEGCLISHIDLPYGLRTIRSLAFNNCSLLKEVSLPETFRNPGDSVFDKGLVVNVPETCNNRKFLEALSKLKRQNSKINCVVLDKYEKFKKLEKSCFTTAVSQDLDENGFKYVLLFKEQRHKKVDYCGLKPFFIKCHCTTDNTAIQRLLDKIHHKGLGRFVVVMVR